MNKLEEKIIQRLNNLIEKGEYAKSQYIQSPEGIIGAGHIEYSIYNEWKNNCENIIIKTSGKESHYYQNFIKKTDQPWPECVTSGNGILRALKDDLEKGLLLELSELVKAEIFTDFLEIADHLLENDYKDPAASLIGATLENGLKDIATKNTILYNKKDGIDDLNKKLAAGSIYNALLSKQVDLWRTIRNSADHGNFKDYSLDDVKNMKNGVESFLANHL